VKLSNNIYTNLNVSGFERRRVKLSDALKNLRTFLLKRSTEHKHVTDWSSPLDFLRLQTILHASLHNHLNIFFSLFLHLFTRQASNDRVTWTRPQKSETSDRSTLVYFLDRFASLLAVRPKEASAGFHTIGDVMPLTASAHVVACATTYSKPMSASQRFCA